MHVEEMANKGRLSYDYERTLRSEDRKKYEKKGVNGRDFIFNLRENYCDFTFFNRFIEQDFIDKFNLMVVGSRINPRKNVKEYYIKSRKAKDYKSMLFDNLYHPPFIKFEQKDDNTLLLKHEFEGQELYREYIPNTLLGLEYLWGYPVQLETFEVDIDAMKKESNGRDEIDKEPVFRKVLYTMKEKKISKEVLNNVT
jgi:stage V sporulation protein R